MGNLREGVALPAAQEVPDPRLTLRRGLTRMTTMLGCAVCEAFFEHKGMHYSVPEILSRLRHKRLRSRSKSRWIELPNCHSADGHSIMATAHMSNHPGLRSVAPGCYLCENTPDFDPDTDGPVEEGAEELREDEALAGELAEAQVPAASNGVDAEFRIEDDLAGPDETTEQLRQEASLMADQDAKGYIAWANSGLRVEIRASSNGGSGSDVTALKKALVRYDPPDNVLVTVTETLGQGDAWITIAINAGEQAALLMSTSSIVDQLVNAGVYDEVLLVNSG